MTDKDKELYENNKSFFEDEIFLMAGLVTNYKDLQNSDLSEEKKKLSKAFIGLRLKLLLNLRKN